MKDLLKKFIAVERKEVLDIDTCREVSIGSSVIFPFFTPSSKEWLEFTKYREERYQQAPQHGMRNVLAAPDYSEKEQTALVKEQKEVSSLMLALEGLIVPNKNILIKRGVAPIVAHESFLCFKSTVR